MYTRFAVLRKIVWFNFRLVERQFWQFWAWNIQIPGSFECRALVSRARQLRLQFATGNANDCVWSGRCFDNADLIFLFWFTCLRHRQSESPFRIWVSGKGDFCRRHRGKLEGNGRMREQLLGCRLMQEKGLQIFETLYKNGVGMFWLQVLRFHAVPRFSMV